MQSEFKQAQMQKIQNMEEKQLCILFGVCILFIVCHSCRIGRNIEELCLMLLGVDITKSEPCNKGCASTMTLRSHVSVVLNKLKTTEMIKDLTRLY